MKITHMINKQTLTRVSYLIELSIILIFVSCQSKHKRKTEFQSVTKDNVSSKGQIEIKQETKQTQNDTLSVQDRFFENNKFHSHIKLDFAKTITKIKDTSQLLLIDTLCAISVNPDTSWINLQQNEMGNDWNEVVSDNQYYEYLAIDTLEKLDIPTFFAPRKKRFIKFIKSDKSSFTIDLKKMKDAWGLILFNSQDNPVLCRSTDIDKELKEIFEINSRELDYKENLKLATNLFVSKSEIPDNVLLKLVPKNTEEFLLLYQTTYPESKMHKTGFFYKTTQKIFDKVIIENNNDFYLPSLQLASFADGEFGEGFIENLEKIIELDTNIFCESIKGKEYSNKNPIKYYAEQNKCE